MPYQRPTLTQLRQQAASDIVSGLPGADGLLRFSNLQVISTVIAGFANQQYGYLDWIAMQAVPFTATDEFLEAWAGLRDVVRLSATQAGGSATFTGVNTTVIPAGTLIVRGDSFSYRTTADGIVAAGTVTVPCYAEAAGATGNCIAGTILVLGNAIDGISSSGVAAVAFTGGSDVETNDSLRARMLEVYQNPPQGGAEQDYETWAREVAGVTRAWIKRNGQGVGTVVVYFMMDVTESAFNGFPQGANGVGTFEDRDLHATGDQLAVANYIWTKQPVTSLVYTVAPYPLAQNFTITSLVPNTTSMKTQIGAAIEDCFFRKGSPKNGKVYMADIQAAINAIPGLVDFVITSPASDIDTPIGALPVLGTITWV